MAITCLVRLQATLNELLSILDDEHVLLFVENKSFCNLIRAVGVQIFRLALRSSEVVATICLRHVLRSAPLRALRLRIPMIGSKVNRLRTTYGATFRCLVSSVVFAK